MRHDQLKSTALRKKNVRDEYDVLEPEFTLLQNMLLARKRVGLSQAEIAERMGTKPPAVTRLESALGTGKHSPSIATLRKYAEAVGCLLEIKLVRNRKQGLARHPAGRAKKTRAG